MSKQDILKNLYSVWGKKPLDHLFNKESIQFYEDIFAENITSSEYMDYARKQQQEGRK